MKEDWRARRGSNPVGDLVKSKRLRGRPGGIWDKTVARSPWLTSADASLLLIFCHLQAQFEKAPTMQASRIGRLRGVASELELTPVARLRLGQALGDRDPDAGDEAESFLRRRAKR